MFLFFLGFHRRTRLCSLEQFTTVYKCFCTQSHLSVRSLQDFLVRTSNNFMSQNCLQITHENIMGNRGESDSPKSPELLNHGFKIQTRKIPTPGHHFHCKATKPLVMTSSQLQLSFIFFFKLHPIKNPTFPDVCPPLLTFLDSFPQPIDNCPRQR